MLDVHGRARDKVVDADDVMALFQKSLAKVGADKSRAAGDECPHE